MHPLHRVALSPLLLQYAFSSPVNTTKEAATNPLNSTNSSNITTMFPTMPLFNLTNWTESANSTNFSTTDAPTLYSYNMTNLTTFSPTSQAFSNSSNTSTLFPTIDSFSNFTNSSDSPSFPPDPTNSTTNSSNTTTIISWPPTPFANSTPGNNTVGPGGGGSGGGDDTLGNFIPEIDFTLIRELPWGAEVTITIALLLSGSVMLFFGSRIFKPVLAMAGLLAGGTAGFYAASLLKLGRSASFGVAAGLGITVAVLCFCLFRLSLFVLGVACGFALWVTIKAVVPSIADSVGLLYGTLLLACLVCGIAAVKMEKVWLLIGTPVLGAFLIVQGLDFFMKYDLNVLQTVHYAQVGCNTTACRTLYSLLIVLAVIGFVVQWKCTSQFANKKGRPNSKRSNRRRLSETEMDDLRF